MKIPVDDGRGPIKFVNIENHRVPWAEQVECPSCYAPAGEHCASMTEARNYGYAQASLAESTHDKRCIAARAAGYEPAG